MGEQLETIRAADAVDPAWLTDVLHRAGVGVGHVLAEVVGRSIGTGQVGDNVRYQLRWHPGAPDLPDTVVGKFPSQSDVSRATAVNLGTYAREIGFYLDLQRDVTIRTPRVLHVGWDADSHDFVVIMEDISPAEQGDQLAGCSIAEAELVVDQAVGLHAPTWGRTEELRGHAWLGFPDPERTQLMAGLVSALFPGFADRYAGRLAARDLELGATLVERFATWSTRLAEWARLHDAWCVVHGDYRLDNILFGGDGAPPVTVVDWQTVTVGTGPSDVAYFCGAGLLPPERAAHERALVERYAAGLAAAGVAIEVDAVWEAYVLGSAGGYVMAVIASQVVERTERGDEMFAVMAERHAAQMRELDLLGRL